MSETIGGKYTVRGGRREGRLGVWQLVSHVDGHIRGALVLETSAFSDQAAVTRLGATLRAMAQLRLPGLLNLTDQVIEGDRIWLVTAVPATPTLAQALDAGLTLPPEAALHIAAETGQTLVKLHAAGLAHGEVSTETVVLAASGVAMLAECGYAHALVGTTLDAGDDSAGWAALVRSLANARADDRAKRVLSEAAGRAEVADLPGALSIIEGASKAMLGYGERGALAALAASVPLSEPAPERAEENSHELATRLGQRASGRSSEAPRAPGEVMRFGAGVAPPPAWDGGTARKSSPRRARRGLKRRITSLISGSLTIGVLAAVGWYLLRDRLDPLAVEGASAVVSAEAGAVDGVISACDTQVDVVGTITTNGRSGAIEYEWIRSDGRTTGIIVERVGKGTDTAQVHLFWEFKGRGKYDAVATLKVHSPTPAQASTRFTYLCE